MRDTGLERGDQFPGKAPSSSDRPVSHDERENHEPALPSLLGDVWIRGWWLAADVSHPPTPGAYLPPYMIPAMGRGDPRGRRGHIYTLRQEKGQAG